MQEEARQITGHDRAVGESFTDESSTRPGGIHDRDVVGIGITQVLDQQAEGVGPGHAGSDFVIGEALGDLQIDILDHDDGVVIGVAVLGGGDGRLVGDRARRWFVAGTS